MNFDELREVWNSSEHEIPCAADGTGLLQAVLKADRSFRRTIAWRDTREIGAGIIAAAAYFYFGLRAAPGSWAIPIASALILLPVWFMVADRIVQSRKEAGFGVAVMESVEKALENVDHQILLLRTVLWWYILPPGAAFTILTSRLTLFTPNYQAGNVLCFSLMMLFGLLVFYAIWRLNQHAVKVDLMPKRTQLVDILGHLRADDASDTSEP